MLALLDLVMIFKMTQKIFCQMENIFSFAKIQLIPKNLFNQVQSGLVSLLHGKLEFLPCIHTELLSFLLTQRKSMVFSEPFQTIPQLELNLMLKFVKIIQEVLFEWIIKIELIYICLAPLVRCISFLESVLQVQNDFRFHLQLLLEKRRKLFATIGIWEFVPNCAQETISTLFAASVMGNIELKTKSMPCFVPISRMSQRKL